MRRRWRLLRWRPSTASIVERWKTAATHGLDGESMWPIWPRGWWQMRALTAELVELQFLQHLNDIEPRLRCPLVVCRDRDPLSRL
jgi:hypothetical protein